MRRPGATDRACAFEWGLPQRKTRRSKSITAPAEGFAFVRRADGDHVRVDARVPTVVALRSASYPTRDDTRGRGATRFPPRATMRVVFCGREVGQGAPKESIVPRML